MKRGTKITLWVVGSLVAIYIFVQLGLDSVATYFVDKEIRKAIVKADLPYIVEYGHVLCLTTTGTVIVSDLHFVNDTVLPDGTKEAVEVKVNNVQVNLDSYVKIVRQKQISLRQITINEPKVSLWTAEKPKNKHQQVKQTVYSTMQAIADTISVPKEEEAKKWIQQVALSTLSVKNGSLTWTKIGSHMTMNVTDVNADVHDLVYSFQRDTFSFCDSIYYLHVGNVELITPDGLVKVEAKDVQTQDGGEIHLCATHVGHTVPKKQLGHIKKEPVTWIDMYVNSVTISETNLFRTKWAEGLQIPMITVDVEHFESFRDNRYDPKHTFQMPQVALLKMKYPLRLDQVDVTIKRLDVGVMKTEKNVGTMVITNASATVCNFSNRRNSRMEANVQATLGYGKADMLFHMTMNKKCNWDITLSGKNVELSALNSLIKPLVAIEVNCHVDSLKAKYKGDKTIASGMFMLGYTGISAKVDPNMPIPYKAISQNAGAIEYFVNNLVPKCNPKYAGKPATIYNVEWEWKPAEEAVPLFMSGPLIMGAVQTYLPGLFVGKKVKTKDMPLGYKIN